MSGSACIAHRVTRHNMPSEVYYNPEDVSHLYMPNFGRLGLRSRSHVSTWRRRRHWRQSGGGGRTGGSGIRWYVYTAGNGGVVAEKEIEPKPDPVRTLTVKHVDLQVANNTKAHHTSEYEITQLGRKLVVRRGQPFNMNIEFNRVYDPVNDDLKLIFQADMLEGSVAMKSKGTHVDILLSDKDLEDQWGAKILSNEGVHLTVTVFTPSDLYVGRWDLSVEVVEKDGASRTAYTYVHPDPLYIIFNPWCKNDEVYMDNEEHLKEYILNETGKIYCGTSRRITSRPWYFGQFDSVVLDLALDLLDAGGLKWTVRGNPIAVVRKMTAMVNSSDDNGVLQGNWSGNYSGGRSPLSWTGSVAILERYASTLRPVKYGQCWVFSGVTTTVMRALGIPSRSVTNFASAHDSDGSITMDFHFNSQGEADDHLNHDSIWNFHVWNEVWMSRPDLPKGFGGWQAIDATPQEASDGVYVCGPVSVQAIRQGDVNMPYDAPFVFAEVNADIVQWMSDLSGNYTPVGIKKNEVGLAISTKACNSSDREDLTLKYKPPEGSPEERVAVMRANQTASTTNKDLYCKEDGDITFSIEHDSERTWVGQDFVVGVKVRNNSSKTRTIRGKIVVKSMFYTGVTCEKIKVESLTDSPLVVKSGKELYHKMVVRPGEYLDKLKDGCMLDASLLMQVQETEQAFASKESYRLRKPHLTIKAPKEAEVGKQFTVEVSFLNPLDKPLTDCVLEVDGLTKDLSFPYGNVASKGTFSASVPVTASRKGQRELIIIFASRQLEDINGSHSIFVRA